MVINNVLFELTYFTAKGLSSGHRVKQIRAKTTQVSRGRGKGFDQEAEDKFSSSHFNFKRITKSLKLQ